MRHSIALLGVLAVVWMLWSGYFEPMLLGLGAASCVAVLIVGRRMDLVDDEGAPLRFAHPRTLSYLVWLTVEIIKANIDVIRRILAPGPLRIHPTMVRVKASQQSAFGIAVFANSITLTPGTVSVDVEDGEILVHAISQEGAADLAGGGFDARVVQWEGTT